jgi:hypothetical protein
MIEMYDVLKQQNDIAYHQHIESMYCIKSSFNVSNGLIAVDGYKAIVNHTNTPENEIYHVQA